MRSAGSSASGSSSSPPRGKDDLFKGLPARAILSLAWDEVVMGELPVTDEGVRSAVEVGEVEGPAWEEDGLEGIAPGLGLPKNPMRVDCLDLITLVSS
jgi:hypothetical protein